MMDISKWFSAFLLRFLVINVVDTGISKADTFALNLLPGLSSEYLIKKSYGRACQIFISCLVLAL